MNRHIVRALLQDAFYQVLDNSVFRILLVVSIVMIAPTLLVSFGESELSVLFGWKTIAYKELGFLSGGAATGRDAQVLVIQGLQSLVVQGLAGTFGILLSLAATAFFVPRMLEKGEADILFSKPVGRGVLLFARYVSGIVFVGALAFLLILGIHLGLLLRSGYSDPGFLWGALTLVYVFAIVHAFSTVVGVFTRSAVTALLSAILFFGMNGCVHSCMWVKKEHVLAQIAEAQAEDPSSDMAKAAEAMDGPLTSLALAVLDTFHYVLPKTHDADVLTKKLRLSISGGGSALEDPVTHFVVEADPEGFARSSAERTVDLATQPFTWTVTADGRERARLSLSRRTRTIERPGGNATKPTRLSAANAATELVREVEGRAATLKTKPERVRGVDLGSARDGVRWRESRGDVVWFHERLFFVAEDWLIELEYAAEDPWREDHPGVLAGFLRNARIQRDTATDLSADDWYQRRFGWTAPFRFNAFASLGSSILFALILLLLARWRLSRIDF